MKVSTHKMRRLGILLVAALAVAAILVPAAAARHDMGMGRVDADAWGVSEYAPQSHTSKSAAASSTIGFQWGDAGIGAGLALGLTALTGSGMLVVRRQRGALRTS
jgi:hypothetical protein